MGTDTRSLEARKIAATEARWLAFEIRNRAIRDAERAANQTDRKA